MPLFHRRALLNSLPAHKRGDAKRAYKKTVADLGASVVVFFVVALVCTLTYHEFVNPTTDRPSGLSSSTQRLLASHQSNSSNLAPSPLAIAVKKTIGPPNFPTALVSPYENGGVIVYLIGMIYTFGISDDVAGATLMAVRFFSFSSCFFLPIDCYIYRSFLKYFTLNPSFFLSRSIYYPPSFHLQPHHSTLIRPVALPLN
jgi:hypothetical protein